MQRLGEHCRKCRGLEHTHRGRERERERERMHFTQNNVFSICEQCIKEGRNAKIRQTLQEMQRTRTDIDRDREGTQDSPKQCIQHK